MIVPGSTSQAVAARLAKELAEPLAAVSYDRFPDGELLATVPGFANRAGDADASRAEAASIEEVAWSPRDDRAVVVTATTTNEAHVELLQLQDAAREADAEEVVTVIPYMGYARQDRVFEAGDPISARAVARAVSSGTDRVVLVSPHEESVRDFFDVPCDVVDAAASLANPLPRELMDPLFLSPDEGAVDIATAVRDSYGLGETDYFEKTRRSGTEVEMHPSDATVEGRDIVITDDMIATGSTMSEAITLLRERDAGRVFAACVHPLLVRNARTKLARAGVEAIYGTDTVERDVSAVSVAPIIADAL